MKKLLLTTLIILMFSSVSFAQGEYFGKGTSGFGAAVGAVFDDGENFKTIQIGYSFEGTIDLNLGAAEIDEKTGSINLGFTYHPFNNINQVLKLSLVTNYSLFKVGSSFDETISIMPIVQTEIEFSPIFFVKPYLGIGFIDFDWTKQEDNAFYQGGIDMFVTTDKKTYYSLTPALVRTQGKTNFGVNFGISFAIGKE